VRGAGSFVLWSARDSCRITSACSALIDSRAASLLSTGRRTALEPAESKRRGPRDGAAAAIPANKSAKKATEPENPDFAPSFLGADVGAVGLL